MLFANDYNDNRVHINATQSNREYYCPYCGAPLIAKKGEIRQYHFAHKQGHLCTDSWERDRSYDISHWHNEWQSIFPEENQEVKLSLGDIRHRADVIIDRTVIEFQHSIMPVKAFDDRNNFYYNLGYKVVWLFDLSDIYANGQLSFKETPNGLDFYLYNPKKAFNHYDIKSGCIDLFFQLNEDKNNCIVRVLDVSVSGFERFYTSNLMSKSDFLSYVGLNNGICAPPCRDVVEYNERYCWFKEKYQINLNKQQERALQAVEGSNLLLAVPGSGKTTVLVARLGHMIINKGISPETILAITYTNPAVDEMRDRFSAKFGEDIGKRIDFRTVNSLSLKIYSKYCQKGRRLIEDKEKKQRIKGIYEEYIGEDASENDIRDLATAITYIKNNMLTEEEILEFESDYPHLSEIYELYEKTLEKNSEMDFDDQMVFALDILQNKKEVADELRARYKYICVDEAQDTSKLQHEIIHILAKGNNIFMVGDEDQSIYGYRGAYPKALLNFRYDYPNPYILRMERNYRSTAQIVDKAQTFISQNKGRYEKKMTAERGSGEKVYLENVCSREEQYMRLLEVALSADTETAFLYRDNESAVVLVDLLLRNKIAFKLRKPEMNFFRNRIVKDIIAYLSLALDENDINSFKKICNKGIIYLKKQQEEYAIKNCKEKHITVFDALDKQMKFVKPEYKGRAKDFRSVMNRVSKATSSEAISILYDEGYGRYLNDRYLDVGKVEILQILAKQEPEIKRFLDRLKELEKKMLREYEEGHIILSTIHSSKGLEYDSVYMVDIYDGRFPSSRPNVFHHSKDNADAEQEERRLFYVGITRARNRLKLFYISDKSSAFIDELFPEQKLLRRQEAEQKLKKRREESERIRLENKRKQREQIIKQQEILERKQEEAKIKERERRQQLAERQYNEVKDKFVQQDTQIRDSTGKRWIKCEICGKIKESSEFLSYGGPNHINLGKCFECSRKPK